MARESEFMQALRRAKDGTRGFASWNPALRGAWSRGFEANWSGTARAACPYEDRRKECGRLTWSRSFINAWQDGWDAAEKQADRAPVAQEGEK